MGKRSAAPYGAASRRWAQPPPRVAHPRHHEWQTRTLLKAALSPTLLLGEELGTWQTPVGRLPGEPPSSHPLHAPGPGPPHSQEARGSANCQRGGLVAAAWHSPQSALPQECLVTFRKRGNALPFSPVHICSFCLCVQVCVCMCMCMCVCRWGSESMVNRPEIPPSQGGPWSLTSLIWGQPQPVTPSCGSSPVPTVSQGLGHLL